MIKYSAYEYRGHFFVTLSGRVLIYRDRLQGEGSPRVNDLYDDRPYAAAMAWLDKQMLPAKASSAPSPVLTLPDFIANDMKRMKQIYFVIEHPSRGCFVGWSDDGDRKPRFRWAITRDHPAIQSYFWRESAEKEMRAIGEKVRKCYIVSMTA